MTSTTEIHVARLAQSVEHQTFNLRVMGSSPISGGNVLIGRTVTVCTKLAISNDFVGSALAFHRVFFLFVLVVAAAKSVPNKREPLCAAGFTFSCQK